MRLPSIHLNGTSRTELHEQWMRAYGALDAAYDVLKQAAPHGRDYYPQGPHALADATDEHLDRLRRLDAIKQEYEQLLEATQE